MLETLEIDSEGAVKVSDSPGENDRTSGRIFLDDCEAMEPANFFTASISPGSAPYFSANSSRRRCSGRPLMGRSFLACSRRASAARRRTRTVTSSRSAGSALPSDLASLSGVRSLPVKTWFDIALSSSPWSLQMEAFNSIEHSVQCRAAARLGCIGVRVQARIRRRLNRQAHRARLCGRRARATVPRRFSRCRGVCASSR